MTCEEAKRAALEEIKRAYQGREDIVVDDKHTITKPYGWVFFYNSRRFLEHGEALHALGGNGPIVVESVTGRVSRLGTAHPVVQEIADFESRNGYGHL